MFVPKVRHSFVYWFLNLTLKDKMVQECIGTYRLLGCKTIIEYSFSKEKW